MCFRSKDDKGIEAGHDARRKPVGPNRFFQRQFSCHSLPVQEVALKYGQVFIWSRLISRRFHSAACSESFNH
jgi:hypothetical protein